MCTILIMVILSRLCDFITTWLITPDLKHESNLLAKKIGFKGMTLMNLLILPACYYNMDFSYALISCSLLVSASNSTGLVHILGGREELGKKYRMVTILAMDCLPGVFYFGFGCVIILIDSYRSVLTPIGFGSFGLGLVVFSNTILLYYIELIKKMKFKSIKRD